MPESSQKTDANLVLGGCSMLKHESKYTHVQCFSYSERTIDVEKTLSKKRKSVETNEDCLDLS